jgi:hypothetical protein
MVSNFGRRAIQKTSTGNTKKKTGTFGDFL